MPKYRVTNPYGPQVKIGDIIETETLHRSLVPHVELIHEGDLVVATPGDGEETEKQKKARLAKEKKAVDLAQVELLKTGTPGAAPVVDAPAADKPAETVTDGPGENS